MALPAGFGSRYTYAELVTLCSNRTSISPQLSTFYCDAKDGWPVIHFFIGFFGFVYLPALLECYKGTEGMSFAILADQCTKIADTIGGLKDQSLDWDALRYTVVKQLHAEMPSVGQAILKRTASMLPDAAVTLP